MALITQPKRPTRAGEWTEGAAILFIVTLAANGTVTLAARAAGMSRKSAYALKKRDPIFAAAWRAAKRAAVPPPEERAEGDTSRFGTPSTSTIANNRGAHRTAHTDYIPADHIPAWRNRLFAELRLGRESTQTAGLC